jgi:hypothetical protein
VRLGEDALLHRRHSEGAAERLDERLQGSLEFEPRDCAGGELLPDRAQHAFLGLYCKHISAWHFLFLASIVWCLPFK